MVTSNTLVAESQPKEKFNLSLPPKLKEGLDKVAERFGPKMKWLAFTSAVAMFLSADEEWRERVIDAVHAADLRGNYDDLVERLRRDAANSQTASRLPDAPGVVRTKSGHLRKEATGK